MNQNNNFKMVLKQRTNTLTSYRWFGAEQINEFINT